MSHQVRIDFDGKQAFLEAEFPAAVGDIIEIEYEDIEGLFRVKERRLAYGGTSPGKQTEVLIVEKSQPFRPDANTTASVNL